MAEEYGKEGAHKGEGCLGALRLVQSIEAEQKNRDREREENVKGAPPDKVRQHSNSNRERVYVSQEPALLHSNAHLDRPQRDRDTCGASVIWMSAPGRAPAAANCEKLSKPYKAPYTDRAVITPSVSPASMLRE